MFDHPSLSPKTNHSSIRSANKYNQINFKLLSIILYHWIISTPSLLWLEVHDPCLHNVSYRPKYQLHHDYGRDIWLPKDLTWCQAVNQPWVSILTAMNIQFLRQTWRNAMFLWTMFLLTIYHRLISNSSQSGLDMLWLNCQNLLWQVNNPFSSFPLNVMYVIETNGIELYHFSLRLCFFVLLTTGPNCSWTMTCDFPSVGQWHGFPIGFKFSLIYRTFVPKKKKGEEKTLETEKGCVFFCGFHTYVNASQQWIDNEWHFV